jgi:hypothetical protein
MKDSTHQNEVSNDVEVSDLRNEQSVAVLLCELRDANAFISKAHLPRLTLSALVNVWLFYYLGSIVMPAFWGVSLGLVVTLVEHGIRRSRQREKIIEQLIRCIASTQNAHRRLLEKLGTNQSS